MTAARDPSPIDPADPIALTQALIRCESVTPRDAGALDVAAAALRRLGFALEDLAFRSAGADAPVRNLFASRGAGSGPRLLWCGHTDVVPVGDRAAWSRDPFSGAIESGKVHGRGACDMKSGVAAMIAAIARFDAARGGPGSERIAVLFTGDEEGPGVDGVKATLAWAHERGERFDFCVIGEPTSPEGLGGMIKVGRRGHAKGTLVARGRQGHTAYPAKGDNAAHRLARIAADLVAEPLDRGSERFQPSALQLTALDAGGIADNVMPGVASLSFGVRYNDLQDLASIRAWIEQRARRHAEDWSLTIESSGDAYVVDPGPMADALIAAVRAETGRDPALDTAGGASDGRHVKDYCPVIEFGLTGSSMHQVDEWAEIAEIEGLTRIYADFMTRFFEGARA